MRKFKKTLSVMLAATMAFSAFSALPFTVSAAEVEANNSVGEEFGDYEYEYLDDGTVEITGYYGEETELVIPSEINGYKVTGIGDWTFYECSSITRITIPNSVTSIGSSAFCECSNLTSVTLPDGLTSIGERAFENCSSLTSITIPDSVTSIDYCAFGNCSSLTSITIPDSVTSIGSSAFCECSNLTSVTLPDGLTSIGERAFENCSSLTSITIPDSVTSIGFYAFNGCSNLTNINISDCATKKNGHSAFYGTAWYYNQPDGVVYFNEIAIDYKGELPENTTISIKPGTKTIGDYAFSGCSNLKDITIPDSVTTIGYRAFYNCDNLYGVKIPASVTSIEERAFGYYYDNSSWHESDWGEYRVLGFTIYGYEGTTAEDYAKANGFDFLEPGEFIPHYNIVGDANGDGEIDIKDATLIQKYSVGIDKQDIYPLDSHIKWLRFACADVNGDGIISILDATCVQKYLAGGYKNVGNIGGNPALG